MVLTRSEFSLELPFQLPQEVLIADHTSAFPRPLRHAAACTVSDLPIHPYGILPKSPFLFSIQVFSVYRSGLILFVCVLQRAFSFNKNSFYICILSSLSVRP